VPVALKCCEVVKLPTGKGGKLEDSLMLLVDDEIEAGLIVVLV